MSTAHVPWTAGTRSACTRPETCVSGEGMRTVSAAVRPCTGPRLRAEARAGEQDDQRLGPVRQLERDHVARPDAGAGDRTGTRLGRGRQCGEARARVALDDGGLPGVTCGRGGKRAPDRLTAPDPAA